MAVESGEALVKLATSSETLAHAASVFVPFAL